SYVSNLSINGVDVFVDGTVNQTVSSPIGQLIINEQQVLSDGTLVVNALHATVYGVADVVVASAVAGANGGNGGAGRATEPPARPAWLDWDGQTNWNRSERDKAKLRHIAQNPHVALNFNTDEDGDDGAVVVGEAKILEEPPPAAQVKAYLRKYREGVKDIGMTVPEFTAAFAIPILVSPKGIRGS